MKISEFITLLEQVKTDHGDNELTIMVRDYFAKGHEEYPAQVMAASSNHPDMWVRTRNDQTSLTVGLDNQRDYDSVELKYPKIIFRKK